MLTPIMPPPMMTISAVFSIPGYFTFLWRLAQSFRFVDLPLSVDLTSLFQGNPPWPGPEILFST
jgi:hypothetical protein